MKGVASRALTIGTEPAFLIDRGSRFQSRIVLGKNDCCLEVVAEWLEAWDTLTMFEAAVCGRS